MPAWTGTKKELCRECIQAIGLDATYNAAQRWCEKRYGTSISEPQFYTVRRDMNVELEAEAARAAAAKPSSVATAVLERAEKLGVAVAPTPKETIADLVKATRALVDKLGGKEEAKSLIDAL